MKEKEQDEKLINRLRRDRLPRILAGAIALVFLAIAAKAVAISFDAADLMADAELELKVEYLFGYTMAIWLATVLFLTGLEILSRAVMGNPIGKLAVRLWDRMQAIEKKQQESEQKNA